MQVTTKAIVFSALKYGESSLIVRAFTASSGMKSYLLRGVLKSKKGRLKAAYFQPLMQLELVANHKDRGTLEHIKEAKQSYIYSTLHTDISKNAIALFLAEMLGNSIREEEENGPLFEYIEASLQWLDTNDQVANFHLLFLLELSKYLGFYPDSTDADLPYLDLVEGAFCDRQSLNPCLTGEQLTNLKQLLGINFDAVDRVRLGKEARNQLLNTLVLYFELHLHGFRKPRSLAVLNEVFS